MAIIVNTARSVCVDTLRSVVDKDATLRREQGARLRNARKAAGYRSAREAALENRWPESTYRAHEGGTRTIGQDDADRYAKRYRASGVRVTGQEILYGTTRVEGGLSDVQPQFTAAKLTMAPLLSWVSAGRLRDAQSQIPVEDVPLLAFADLGRGEFFALRVEGDSMDRVSPEGSVIVVNRVDRELAPGRCYVFMHRGETTFKRWQPAPDRLAPFSTNPVHEPIFIKRQKDFDVIGRVRRTVLDL